MKKNILVIALLVVSVVAVVEIRDRKNAGDACSACAGVPCSMPDTAGVSSDVPASPVKKTLPRLLDLGSGKCVPCKMMMPILKEMKQTFAGQLDVEFIDVWENEGVAEQYGVHMIPTQIFYDADGRERYRHEGFFSREELLAKWTELGVVLHEEE